MSGNDGLTIIEADSITVEIVDKESGKTFRRTLLIKYLETDNGVILSGETLTGVPCEIALLSDAAVARMIDVTGRGPDSHRCGND